MDKTTLETTSYSSYQGNIVLSKGIDVAVGVDDSLTPSPKKHTAVVFMFLFITNIKTMLLSRKSLFAVVALLLLMAAVDYVATKTPYSTKISSSVNYLIGTDWHISDYPAPGSCEIDGCGLSNFVPTEDCKWGDASYPKDKGDQQGQKPGCTFCYSSEKDSEDSYKAWFYTNPMTVFQSEAEFRHLFNLWLYYNQLHETVLSGVCKFKLPIGAECTSWSVGLEQGLGLDGIPRIANRGSNEHCMTNICVSDDPNSPYSKWHCKA